jgi:MFS family permease
MRWVYSVFPASLAAGPLGTLVQLYLIELNGIHQGTLYISVAVAVYNAVGIPAAVFWGFATDRIHQRRLLIASSYAVTAAILASLYFDSTTAGTIFTYASFSFVSAASATPLNLLIMETSAKARWAGAFARLSMISSMGTVGGLLLGAFWVQALPLLALSVPLSLFALASTVMAVLTLPRSEFVLEPATVVMRRPSFFHRLLALPMIFISPPRLSDFRRSFRGARSGLTRHLPFFYISIFMFYLSSGLFNTSLVPAMSSTGIAKGPVFAAVLSGMLVQTVSFQFAGRYVERRPLSTTSIQGLLLRGVCYGGIGVAALFLTGYPFLAAVLVLYPIAGGVAFSVYYTSSNTMMFNSVKKSPGAALGVYSAIVGLASAAGSLASGAISVYWGFYLTFTLASILLYAAVFVVTRIPAAEGTSAAD